MVELQHRAIEPAELTAFRIAHPTAPVSDFDSPLFRRIKEISKAALNRDQGELCAYCEQPLLPAAGHIDHIKPKGGPNAQPHLCFTYTNYAQSCNNIRTCGQKKKSGLLPIEPGPGCNGEWLLSTDGTIEPLITLRKRRKHEVKQTRDMLGLNADSNLVDERKKWLNQTLALLQQAPDDIHAFLEAVPFRHILTTVL